MRALLVALAFCASGAFAQSDARLERRDGLMRIMAEHAEDPVALGQQTRKYLAALSSQDAFDAEADLYRWAWNARAITRLEFGRQMLELNKSYAPDDESTLDYWRYVVMIAAKLERGEIALEEYQYLEARKLAEAGRSQRAAQVQERQQAAPVVIYRDPGPDPTGEALQAIGRAMRKPSTTTNCVNIGNTSRCTTR